MRRGERDLVGTPCKGPDHSDCVKEKLVLPHVHKREEHRQRERFACYGRRVNNEDTVPVQYILMYAEECRTRSEQRMLARWRSRHKRNGYKSL
eukprot:3295719-Rhodomonas_salina.1